MAVLALSVYTLLEKLFYLEAFFVKNLLEEDMVHIRLQLSSRLHLVQLQ